MWFVDQNKKWRQNLSTSMNVFCFWITNGLFRFGVFKKFNFKMWNSMNVFWITRIQVWHIQVQP
jgi:hypothetical protein